MGRQKNVTTEVVEKTPEEIAQEEAQLLAELEAEEAAEKAKLEAETVVTEEAPTEVVEEVDEAPVEQVEEVEEEPKTEQAPVVEAAVAPEQEIEPEAESHRPTDVIIPVPKTVANKRVRVIQTEPLTGEQTALKDVKIEELIKIKHEFDLSRASAGLRAIIDFFARYEETMAVSKNPSQAIGESLQKQLFKTYLTIFMLDSSKERDVAMEYLLWKFHKNEKGVFSVVNLSRFTRGATWIIQDLSMYTSLNHIFYSISEPTNRIARLRGFKLPAIIQTFPSDRVRVTDGFISWAKAIQ